ncbi:peptidoglycan endopeptidase [Embleya scabrispora]|uniref:peptidoglycan endopeptidase n=1 Tax=Embleya scabrispora TaxID=159449 RepID=UPI000373ED5B|nr:peptidoglycan endopeptidase [Embleya scabrispora]
MLSANARHRAARPTNVRRFVAAVGIAGMGVVIPVAAAGTAHAYAPSTSEQVPSGASAVLSATPTAAVESAPVQAAPAASETAAPADKAGYVVKAGDTLSRLAQTNQVTGGWQSLYELNRDVLLSGPDLIRIGQTLKLTGSAPALSKAAAPAQPSIKVQPKTGVTPGKTTTKPSAALSVKPAAKAPAKPATGGSKGNQAPTGGASTASSSKAAQAVAFAKAQIGKPYVYGATGPNAYDCSGLVQAAYKSAGISLPRVTNDQFAADPHVSIANLQPGDLVFFYSGISHVGIYIGDGKMVHAANPRKPVEIASINTMPIAGATRPV